MASLVIYSKGKDYICLFDERDKELVSQFQWSLHSQGYAQTTVNGKTVLMHRLILGIVDRPDIEVDHRFHKRLDNRRSEIRRCTHSQNMGNSRKLKASAHSLLKGIYRERGLWHAQIRQDQKVKNLGRYYSDITAAKVYDRHALEIFRDFAFVNFQSSMEAQQLKFPWI